MTTSAFLAVGDRAPAPYPSLTEAIAPRGGQSGNGRPTLLALALGSFVIGTSEFASMGIIQLFAQSLDLSLAQATDAITAYAVGVVLGAPLITLAAARMNRRTLLLSLMLLFIIGNLLSAMSASIGWLAVARFISGLPQGAYFGAGAVVAAHVVGEANRGRAFAIVMTGLTIATIVGSPLATFLGQALGWRETYIAVSALAFIALASIWLWVPRTSALDGTPVAQELLALCKPAVWAMMAVAAIGVGSIFAVYTFIAPMVTDVVRLPSHFIPIALAIFGIGMTAGNLLGGRTADRHPVRSIAWGFGSALVTLALLALLGGTAPTLLVALFGVGASMMFAIPAIQVRLNSIAPEAPSLMGAMNLAALNAANAIGAWAAGRTVAAGSDVLASAWSGFGLTLVGLAMFSLVVRVGHQRAARSGNIGLPDRKM